MTSSPRHVFISVPHGTSAGNMLRSGALLDRMLESDPSLHVVLLSPMSKDPQFIREFERARVTFVDQPAHVPAGLEARLLAIVQASYLDQGQTESVRIRLEEARANRRLLYWLMIDAGFASNPSEWWHFSFGDQMWAKLRNEPEALYAGAEAPR